MKIIVCGKGGSGKSTLTALISIAMKNRGYNVLLIDADESNFGLHRMIGVSHPVTLLDSFGGKKGFREKTASTFPPTEGIMPFNKMIQINEIPETCVSRANGMTLLVIGKVHHFGEGCACPMGAISRMVLSKLIVKDHELVLIDTAAGIEHFGRKVDAGCDLILGIVDPTFESFILAKRMLDLAAEAGIEIFFVLNKMDEKVKEAMMQNMDQKKVMAEISQSPTLFMAGLKGNKMTESIPDIDPICQWIEDFKKVPDR